MDIRQSILSVRSQFREDPAWGMVLFIILIVPLLFTLVTYEKYEIVKMFAWMVGLGLSFILVFRKSFGKSFGEKKAMPIPLFFLGSCLFFLLWGVASTVHSVDWLNSLFGLYPRFSNSLLFYSLWAGLVFLLVVLQTKQRLMFALKLLIFDGLIVGLVGIMQSLGIAFYGGLSAPGFQRAPSLLGNANFSSMFIVCLLPIIIALALKTVSFSARVYYWITALVLVCATVMLSSRGAWAALGISLVLFSIFSAIGRLPKKYWVAPLLVLLLAVGLGYASLSATRPDAVSSTITLNETNINLRFFVWNIAVQGMHEHPLLGSGLANFQIIFERHRVSTLADQSGVYDDAHNLFLLMAATGGIPFALAFCALLGSALFVAITALRKNRDEIMAALICGISAFIIAACFTPVPTGCFVLLAVFVSGCFIHYTGATQYSIPKGVQLFFRLVGGVLVIGGLCFFISEVLFFQGYEKFFQNKYETSYRLMNAAIHINPTNQYFYLYKIADEIGLKKDPLNIEAQLAPMIAIHKTDASSYMRAVNIEYVLYKVTENKIYLDHAISTMKESLQLDPYFAERYGQIGYFYLLKGDDATALAYDKYAVSLDQSSVPSWLLLANIYQVQHKRTQVIYSLEQIYKKRPDIQALSYLLKAAKQSDDIQNVNIPIGILSNSLE